MAKTKFCIGVSAISDTYSGVILDQWGVLHNGRHLYEGVIECMDQLRARKKTIILLSNALTSAAEEKAKLKKMGLGSEYYDEIMTSGEYMRRGLSLKEAKPFDKLGKNAFLFEQKKDFSLLDDIDVNIVDTVQDADFSLLTGLEKVTDMKTIDTTLRETVRRRLPCICANPDSRQLMTGDYIMGSGLLARKYQDFGGVVHFIGKPHSLIFNSCVRFFQEKEIYPGSIVVIGDTMAHDIIGGSLVNIDTALIKSGLHAPLFHRARSPAETDKLLKGLIAQYNNTMPRYLIDRFQWGEKLPDRKHKVWKRRRTAAKSSS